MGWLGSLLDSARGRINAKAVAERRRLANEIEDLACEMMLSHKKARDMGLPCDPAVSAAYLDLFDLSNEAVAVLRKGEMTGEAPAADVMRGIFRIHGELTAVRDAERRGREIARKRLGIS